MTCWWLLFTQTFWWCFFFPIPVSPLCHHLFLNRTSSAVSFSCFSSSPTINPEVNLHMGRALAPPGPVLPPEKHHQKANGSFSPTNYHRHAPAKQESQSWGVSVIFLPVLPPPAPPSLVLFAPTPVSLHPPVSNSDGHLSRQRSCEAQPLWRAPLLVTQQKAASSSAADLKALH